MGFEQSLEFARCAHTKSPRVPCKFIEHPAVAAAGDELVAVHERLRPVHGTDADAGEYLNKGEGGGEA